MRTSRHGFTLVEVLVALSVFVGMVTLLLSISGQTANIWKRQQDLASIRERARLALEVIGSELRLAVMPVDLQSSESVQLVVNPTTVLTTFNRRDSLFWFVPIATTPNGGNLAKVGYFIREDDGHYQLCRLYVPSSSVDFLLYQTPDDWVNGPLLDRLAPANAASKFKGLFLPDVPGMWVNAFDESGNLVSPPDTRATHRLPARIDLSLVFLDHTGAEMVKGGLTLPSPGGSATAQAYLQALPSELREHAGAVSVSVSFQARRR